MKMTLTNKRGFTLIELIMIIIVIGILASVATMNFGNTLEDAKFNSTQTEMTAIATAIVGNPNLYAKGARSDFGYVGDIGALPINLDALASNPGGYGTWDGPYIRGDFDVDDFKKDGWAVDYTFTDTLLRSTGSGSNIDKVITGSTASLLANTVSGYVLDASMDMPGVVYNDSLIIRFTYPDGSGGTTISSINPNSKGIFSFASIPVGNHNLTVIYTPDSDTINCLVCVTPGSNLKLDIIFPADLW